MQTNLIFPALTFEKQVEEALLYQDPIKLKALLALGTKFKDIDKIAKNILRDTDNIRSVEQNISYARGWNKSSSGNVEIAFLNQVFSIKNPGIAEEAVRFYLSAGGDLTKVSHATASLNLPVALGDKTQFLDLLRRIIKLGQAFLNERGGKEPPKKLNFIFWQQKNTEVRERTSGDEIEKISSLFSLIVQKTGEERIFHHACALGLKDLALHLVDLGVAVNCKFPSTDATPLHTAAYFGKVDLISWLLDNGAEIDALTKVVEHQEGDRKISKGMETPLHMAAMEGRLDAVALLLQRGASLEFCTVEGHTPFHYACFKDPEIANLFLKEGVNVNVKNNKGVTPLHYAAISGLQGLFLDLIAEGADLSVKDDYNQTPLEVALDKEDESRELFQKLLSANKTALKLMNHRTPTRLISHCKTNPQKLIVDPSEIETSNPLEIPFLFNSGELASFLKILMPNDQFELALNHLQKKYPKQTFSVLIDAGTSVDKTCIAKLGRNPIPKVPDLSLEKLIERFGKVQFFTAPALMDVPQEQIYINPEGSIMQRSVVSFRNSKRENVNEIRFERKVFFHELEELDFSSFKLNRSGKISTNERTFPYVILKIDETYMPVKLYKKEGTIIIELRIELLNALLSDVNFTNENLPGYRDPKTIIDSGSTTSELTRISPLDLKRGLKAYCDAINFQIPYTGTPPENKPAELKLWYQYLELIAKHDLLSCISEDLEAIELIANGKTLDPTPSAPSLIELAISGLHCGTRALDDTQFIYDAKNDVPKTVKDRVLGFVDKYKTGIASKMVDLDHEHNVHIKNKILQIIDEGYGITEEEKAGKYYFFDPIAPKVIDREKIMKIFTKKFTNTQIIDLVNRAINGSPSEIDRDLIIDWFKDNTPDDYQAEKYAKISKNLPDGDRFVKAKYLEQFDIFFNPVDLKRPQEPNWEKVIDDDRRYLYLQDFVQNQMTGKINREAIISMLVSFGVLIKV